LRLTSGVILFVYVAAHFVNHALGLISIAVAERGLRVAVAVWQSPLGTLVLYGAAGTHIALAFLALYQHRTLRMPPPELLRIALGLSLPTLLIAHVVGTRLAFELYEHPPDYAHVVWMLWHSGREGRQLALLVPGWIHGCMGINFAFGKRAWYQRLRLSLFGAALLLPAFAVLGFLSMLKEVSLLAQDTAWVAATVLQPDDATQHLALGTVRDGLLMLYFGAIAAVFAARAARTFVEKRRGSVVSIGYPDRAVRVPRGWSVLEASRSHHIAHVSICGGRARCSTCRVRVLAGEDQCPLPADDERRTLLRIRAAEGTRLACQLRPLGDITVVPLLTAAPRLAWHSASAAAEHEVAVMLVDFRWRPSQRRLLPHDLLYVLNRFSETVGGTTRAAGGLPIQFMGDRVMVLFGLEVVPLEANHQALVAAVELDMRVTALHAQLQRELGCETEHVIHLHAGMAAVGETGDRLTRTLTATGGAIDVVRQIAAIDAQCATRRQHSQNEACVVVSRPLWVAAQRGAQPLAWHEFQLPCGTRIEIAQLDSACAGALH
jgi:adenylate cyclase